MDFEKEQIEYAVANTEILRLPKQKLSSFGVTNIHYYMVTEASYSEVTGEPAETVIREGRVIAERPRIVTPYYLSRCEGFSTDALKYFTLLMQQYGSSSPGIFYTYKNEAGDLSIVTDSLLSVVDKLNDDIDRRDDPLTTIIKGTDQFWDISLLKFIFELTSNSVQQNLMQMGSHGLLSVDSQGIPADARRRIEMLFSRARKGEIDPQELKAELDHWDVFDEYQDRFFSLFR